MAKTAILESLSVQLGDRLPSLFEPTPQEISSALGSFASGDRFAALARDFFARLTYRSLDYYLSRELANHNGQRFMVEIPVRDCSFWSSKDVTDALEELLMFPSEDRFEFQFSQNTGSEAERSKFFEFNEDSAWHATRVLMFSGGLDSFAGAQEEIAEQGQRVALVSHFSASKIAPVQLELQKALAKEFGADMRLRSRVPYPSE